MRIAFYAPMKAPHHPLPSGDRQMARLLVRALSHCGHTVELASSFRSLDVGGDGARQRRLAALGGRLAARLVRRYRRRGAAGRPQLWFTYHCYHKAPDWLGPPVTRALRIPYLIAEASYAPKQAGGRWALGHAAAAEAISVAERIIALNPADGACLCPLLADPARMVALPPFIDAAPFAAAAAHRPAHRRELSARLGLAADTPLLLTVAMMRAGDKLASYRVLGRALAALGARRWRLLVVGDGPAEAAVGAALAPLGRRVHRLGRLQDAQLAATYAAADLYLWPAVGEAYGIALLEAQAAALPVLAGRTGGVPEVVADGESGVLVPVGDAAAFAAAVAPLLDDAARRRAMGRRAQARVRRVHDLPVAARALDAVIQGIGAGRSVR